MHAKRRGWMRCKTAGIALLWMAVVGATGSLALPQRAFAMSVQVPPLTEPGFSIVFDLDFVDNVLRVTLPKSAEAVHDVLTLSHPLDKLDQVVVDFIPDRGVRVRFDSEPLGSGSSGSPGAGASHGSTGAVPEPTSAALLALGLFGASCVRRRRRP